MFIAEAGRYFEFGLFTGSLKTDLANAKRRIAGSSGDSFEGCFRFIQAVERFGDIAIAKFLNALCFDQINLTSCPKMLKHSTIMSTTDHLRFKGPTPQYFWSCLSLSY